MIYITASCSLAALRVNLHLYDGLIISLDPGAWSCRAHDLNKSDITLVWISAFIGIWNPLQTLFGGLGWSLSRYKATPELLLGKPAH